MFTISVILPVYNEEKTIGKLLEGLPFSEIEVIVVDAASKDRTLEVVKKFPVCLIESAPSRSLQMNKGAKISRGDILLFLHADCQIKKEIFQSLRKYINKGYVGGCFKQHIHSDKFIYRLIEFSGNLRAKLFKIFYGDQGIFVRRDIFFKIGGFPSVSLFEDVLFSKKLKREGKVCVLEDKIFTSPRRWQRQGIIKTTFINWLVSLGFIFGISPDKLKRFYKDIR